MANLLKVTVVILLVVAIAALCIQAVVLFPKRTLIKERTQRLERGVNRVATTLHRSLPEETKANVSFNQNRLQVAKTEELPQLDGELNRANLIAEAVVQAWDYTKADLENTRQDLENTRAELDATKAELEAARTQIVQLNDTIRQKNDEISERDRSIAMLEDEKSSLEGNISSLQTQVADMEELMAEVEAAKALLQTQLEQCEGELNVGEGSQSMPEGTTGRIVYTNPEWNFVVIDVGAKQEARPGAEMIIHRGDTMVGKIRISAVQDTVSIAEVLSDYQMDAVREGDDVLY